MQPQINYIELPAADFTAAKKFFGEVFGWRFTDYGAQYVAFAGGGLDGGFYQSELKSASASGAALVVFRSEDLELTQRQIETAGGVICKPIFAFPGGRRFHFTDPNGNEFAVWQAA